MKVVILGSGVLFTNLIAGCIDAGADVVGVFRYEKVKYSFIDRFILDLFNPSKEYSYIKSRKLYEINATKANSAEFKKEILRLNADIILVGSWGERLKKSIYDLPKISTINVHPSLLPKYRGPNPYLQAISHMEQKSGVTFHLMDENYDTGAILYQRSIDISDMDTGKELREKIAYKAREGVCELLNKLNNEIIIPVNQDESKSSYFSNIKSEDVMIDFNKSAKEISSQIRGFHPWARCFFPHNTHFFTPNPYKIEIIDLKEKIGLEAGTIIDKSFKNKSITVVCGDGNLLKMQGLKLFGFLKPLTRFYIKLRVKRNRVI